MFIKKIRFNILKIIVIISVFSVNSYSYTEEDRVVWKACKDRVYKDIHNGYDKISCTQMFQDYKDMAKKIGASKTYDYLDDVASEEGWEKEF